MANTNTIKIIRVIEASSFENSSVFFDYLVEKNGTKLEQGQTFKFTNDDWKMLQGFIRRRWAEYLRAGVWDASSSAELEEMVRVFRLADSMVLMVDNYAYAVSVGW